MQNSTRELLLNVQGSTICDLNKKTPVCVRGLMTTKRYGDEHLEYAYHYMWIEIYFNSFSSFFEKKHLFVVSIKNFMGITYV